MDLLIIGPGRAGGSIARAAVAAGHRLVGVLSRSPTDLEPVLSWDALRPSASLGIVAVTDSAIHEVAERLAPVWPADTPVAHLSGFRSVRALDPIGGVSAGSFHPLQTLPDPEHGADGLRGAWAAITADEPLASLLERFADDLGMHPFHLEDEAKPAYHAAAAAGANYVVESLAVAFDLLAAANVPFQVLEPLTRRVVENVFALGPAESLTGPIARGDLETVTGQMQAAAAISESLGRQFRLLAEATAVRAGVRLDFS